MRVVRLVARLLLALYPPGLRRRWGRDFLATAEHRLRLERRRGRRGAVRRTLAVLLGDAVGAAPREWWRAITGPGATERRRLSLDRRGAVRGWVEGWVFDTRIAARSLARRPGLSALVAGTLAVGIGANAAIFGVLDRTVLAPFRFQGGDRVVYVVDREVERGLSLSPTQTEVERWREGARTVEAMEVFQAAGALLTGRGEAERVAVTRVSLGLPGMAGVRPPMGRSFGPDDALPDAAPVAMIHEDAWRSRFGGDRAVIGSTVTLSDVPTTVIGVWPRDVRVQLDADPVFFTVLPRGEELDRSMFSVVLARLAPGVAPEDARDELRSLQEGIEPGPGTSDVDYPADVVPPYTFLGGEYIRGLWILFAGAGLLLLVASANAATLLLDRTVDREAELGVRLALGGGPLRLLRQFLLEGGLLAGAGGLAAMGLARLAASGLDAVAPEEVPSAVLQGGDGRVVAYAAGVALAATLVCALVPAVHAVNPGIRRLLASRSGDGGATAGRRLRSWLVGAQVTLAVVLVAGSVLTLRSLLRLAAVDPGFAVEELAMATVRAPSDAFPTGDARRGAYRTVVERLAGLPTVSAASASGVIPFNFSIRFGEPFLEGDEPPPTRGDEITRTATTTPGFLETMGIPLLAGRDFRPGEREDPAGGRVVLVSEGFARRYPGGVLGRGLRFAGDTVAWRIVGVVGEVHAGPLRGDRSEQMEVYYPSDGESGSDRHRFLVRAPHPEAVVPALRAAIRDVDPSLVVESVRTGDDLVAAQTEESRFLAVLLAVLAGLSLALAVAGVFGAVSLAVTRTTRDIGIRRALGADGTRVAGAVLGQGLKPVVIGTAAGALLAAVLARLTAAALYETSPTDPVSLAAAAVVPLASAVVACLLPALRATRVQPARALRQD